MLKELLKVANKLDALGLSKEADTVDTLIQKMASPYDEFSRGEIFNRPRPVPTEFDDKKEFPEEESKISPESLDLAYSDFDWNLDPSGWDSLQWEAWPQKLNQINSMNPSNLSKESRAAKARMRKMAQQDWGDEGEDLEEMGFRISDGLPRDTEGVTYFDIETASCRELKAQAVSLNNIIQMESEEYMEKEKAFRTGAWIQENNIRFATPEGRSDYLNDIVERLVASKEELELVEEAMQKCPQ